MKLQSLDCPNCGASVPDDSKFCSYCGSGLILSDDRMRFYLVGAVCPLCHADNRETDRYCGKCGTPLLRTCPFCLNDVPVDSVYCPVCRVEIEAQRDQIAVRINILEGEINSRRVIQYTMIALMLVMVIGGFALGGVWPIGGIVLSIPVYGLYRWLRRKTDDQLEELNAAREALNISQVA